MFPNFLRSQVLSRLATRETTRIYFAYYLQSRFASLVVKKKFCKTSKSLKILWKYLQIHAVYQINWFQSDALFYFKALLVLCSHWNKQQQLNLTNVCFQSLGWKNSMPGQCHGFANARATYTRWRMEHGLLNLHGRTYYLFKKKKKIVAQIFCFDWEEISEKMSK